MKMMGKLNKPFCGDCCSEYRQGSGKAHKRIIVKIQRQREKRFWRADI